MPTVDVTELFDDPDLASPLLIIRRRQIMDNHGRAINVPTTTTAVGVIQPARPRTLAMLPDLSRTSGAVEVWCRFDLKEGTQGTAPDEVVWLGQTYTVANVQRWANEGGASWTHAVCELKALVAPEQSVEVEPF
jgi:hypothetical protein